MIFKTQRHLLLWGFRNQRDRSISHPVLYATNLTGLVRCGIMSTPARIHVRIAVRFRFSVYSSQGPSTCWTPIVGNPREQAGQLHLAAAGIQCRACDDELLSGWIESDHRRVETFDRTTATWRSARRYNLLNDGANAAAA